MKQLACLLCALGFMASLYAQPLCLPITTHKTTSLVFPLSIKHIDRGSRNVLATPVREADNILLVKAATTDFTETNLSVVTADGAVYCFTVIYEAAPHLFVYHLPLQTGTTTEMYANSLIDNPPLLHNRHRQNGLVEASLTGIYTNDSTLFFQLQLTNHSPIDYDVAYQRFSIQDQRQSPHTAMQEIALEPLYIAKNLRQVKTNSRVTEVIALPKFTLPDHKRLVLEIGERNGGRKLQLVVRNRHLFRAYPLVDRNETGSK